MSRSIEERVLALEEGFSVPGTQITRHLKPKEGLGWCVAIGMMGMPKAFYFGDTIEEALSKAEAGRGDIPMGLKPLFPAPKETGE